MNASTLEHSVSEFSKSLSSLNGWLVVMTAIVVAGLLIEYSIELKEKWEEFVEAGAWKSLLVFRSKAWKPLAIFLGAVMVTAGVAGEMVFEGWSFHKEGQLETAHANLEDFLRNQSQSAEDSANGAKEDFRIAKQQLGVLSLRAQGLTEQMDTAKSKLRSAEAAEKQEENTLINTAVCLAPRVIPFWTISTDEANALKLYSNRRVTVEFVPDPEARRAAISLANALVTIGWKPKDVTLKERVGLHDGVEIAPYPRAVDVGTIPEVNTANSLNNAAGELIRFLHSYNWQATRGWAQDIGMAGLPPSGLIIAVGLYPPMSYIAPPGGKAFSEYATEQEQKFQQASQNEQARLKELNDESLKGFTPKEAARERALQQQFETERGESLKPYAAAYSNPCQDWSAIRSPEP